MADDGIFAKISGIPDFKAALLSIVPKLRRKALREALTVGARIIQKQARRYTPVLQISTYSGLSAFKRGRRKKGTVQRAISVRSSKVSKAKGDVGVFVNVRPASRAQRGTKSANDPFYWRWLNWGWNPGGGGKDLSKRNAGKRQRRAMNKAGGSKAKPGAYFLEKGAAMLNKALQAFIKDIGPRIQKLNGGKNVQI